MRAQCCICADLFENNPTVNIAAAPCGHTFHETCLMRWLDTSATCPSCRKHCNRKQVIAKLFFDGDEIEETREVDPSKLVNQVSDLKATVRQRDKEKSELIESKVLLQNQVQDVMIEKEVLKKELKQEKNTNSSLKKQISTYEGQQKLYRTEQDEYRKATKTLKDLQHLQVMLSGCESDALEILHQNGEGSSKQLSRYCAILKREYEQCKQDKKLYKDQIDKLRRELVTKDRILKDKTQENSTLTEHLNRSEEDLKNTEKEKELLRHKLRHLRKAVRSPTGATASSSFIETLTEESPLTHANITTPVKDSNTRLFEEKGALTPDLFDTPNTQTKHHCSDNNMKYVRIVSASENQPSKRQRTEKQEINDLKTLGSLNIFKKKNGPGSFSSTIQKGYDGLGGHTSFTKPLGPLGVKNTLVKKKKTTSTGVKMFAKNPPLPSLDNFIEID
ncbi:hypothetical protein SNE40_013481 [Patella caerulea]|uniref:RING-type domain-containing protein n=1 Tax=Patella caerulea TaxID=87958 RepID=A0AAN8JJG5_PATCE